LVVEQTSDVPVLLDPLVVAEVDVADVVDAEVDAVVAEVDATVAEVEDVDADVLLAEVVVAADVVVAVDVEAFVVLVSVVLADPEDSVARFLKSSPRTSSAGTSYALHS
jgi:hypothetical protein